MQLNLRTYKHNLRCPPATLYVSMAKIKQRVHCSGMQVSLFSNICPLLQNMLLRRGVSVLAQGSAEGA